MNIATKLRRLAALGLPEQDHGQGLVEYSLIIMLVALAVVAGLGAFGGDLRVIYEFINSELPFV